MKDESSSKTAAEERHERNMLALRQKFGGILAADKKKIADDEPDQNPHSRAYRSTCSFTKSKTLTKDEEKRAV
jgi:hypothetical protein